MPESKGREKRAYTPPAKPTKVKVGNPRWFVPVMLTLMVVGLIWVVTFYITEPAVPDRGDRPLEPRRRLRPDDGRLRDDHPLALTACAERCKAPDHPRAERTPHRRGPGRVPVPGAHRGAFVRSRPPIRSYPQGCPQLGTE